MREAHSVRILHVSDIHFGCKSAFEDQGRITDALVAAAVAFCASRKPDLIVFSGDLAHAGTASEFREGERWLHRLVDAFHCPCFVVPGNHDTTRPEKSRYEDLDSFRMSAADNGKYRRYRDKLLHGGLENFLTWHASARASLDLVSDWSENPFGCVARMTSNGVQLAIVGINTSFASLDDTDQGKLFADIASFNRHLRDLDTKSSLIVAVSHHPILSPDKTDNWLVSWNNNKMHELLAQTTGPHIYLHGHVHQASGQSTSESTGASLLRLGAGAAYQGSEYDQSFAFIDIDLEKSVVAPSVFSYHNPSGTWLPDSGRSQPVRTALPSFDRPNAGSSRLPQPTASETAIERLTASSRAFARHYMPEHILKTEAVLDSLKGAFAQTTSIGSNPRDSTDMTSIVEQLTRLQPRDWTIVGEAESGQHELAALLFWLMLADYLKSGDGALPIFIDIDRHSAMIDRSVPAESADDLASLIEAISPSTPIVAIVIDNESRLSLGSQRLRAALQRFDAISLIWIQTSSALRDAAAQTDEDTLVVRMPNVDTSAADAFIDAFLPAIAVKGRLTTRQMKSLVVRLCQTHRLPISPFLIRACAISLVDNANLSDVLKNWFVSQWGQLSKTAAAPSIDEMLGQLAKQEFDVFRSGIDRNLWYRDTVDAEQKSVASLRAKLGTHPALHHWFVATHVQSTIEAFADLLLQRDSDAGKDEKRALLASIEMAYPVAVNAFSKELFATALSQRPEKIKQAINEILNDENTLAGRRLRAHAAYLAGRIADRRAQPIFELKLRKVASGALGEIRNLRAFQISAKVARKYGARELSARLRQICIGLFGCYSTDQALGRAEREMLLVERSAYISLAYLGDREAADTYIAGLLRDSNRDDLNRGFHLEYYGDTPFLPNSALLASDNKLLPCPLTFDALMKCLEDRVQQVLDRGSESIALATIQVATLSSLARHRHAAGVLDNSWRPRIVKCLRSCVENFSLDRELDALVRTTCKELSLSAFVVERYVDGLYELKHQPRTGWEKLEPVESVAAHSYFVELLSRFFVPDHVKVDHLQLYRVAALHDVGEAITGDIQMDMKHDPEKEQEAEVVQQISHVGALVRSSSLMKLADEIGAFEGRAQKNAAAESIGEMAKTDEETMRYAREMDRLDLLIQMFRYRREHGTFGRYEDFRAYVDPGKFQVRSLRERARRFVDYYESEGLKHEAGYGHWRTRATWPMDISIARARVRDTPAG